MLFEIGQPYLLPLQHIDYKASEMQAKYIEIIYCAI